MVRNEPMCARFLHSPLSRLFLVAKLAAQRARSLIPMTSQMGESHEVC
jgi:hypothetical protein